MKANCFEFKTNNNKNETTSMKYTSLKCAYSIKNTLLIYYSKTPREIEKKTNKP